MTNHDSRSAATNAAETVQRVELALDDGTHRWSLLSLPVTDEDTYPLVIDLHGFAEGATMHAETTGLAAFGRTRGFMVATPHGTPIGDDTIPQWATTVGKNRDVAFISQLIDHLLAAHPIDPDRIYVAGFSNGALLTAVLLCHLCDRIAGAALVAGGRLAHSRHPAVPVPIILLHGTEDPIVPFAGGPVRAAAFRTEDDLVATAAEHQESPVDIAGDLPMEDLRRVCALPLLDLVGDYARTSGLSLAHGQRLDHGVTRYVWGDGDGHEVHLCIIQGAGHHWPGSQAYLGLESILGPAAVDVSANELIWAFFRSRPSTENIPSPVRPTTGPHHP